MFGILEDSAVHFQGCDATLLAVKNLDVGRLNRCRLWALSITSVDGRRTFESCLITQEPPGIRRRVRDAILTLRHALEEFGDLRLLSERGDGPILLVFGGSIGFFRFRESHLFLEKVAERGVVYGRQPSDRRTRRRKVAGLLHEHSLEPARLQSSRNVAKPCWSFF